MLIVLGGDGAVPDASAARLVGGERDGELVSLMGQPLAIALSSGSYVRGLRCTDDGIVRYVWKPTDPA